MEEDVVLEFLEHLEKQRQWFGPWLYAGRVRIGHYCWSHYCWSNSSFGNDIAAVGQVAYQPFDFNAIDNWLEKDPIIPVRFCIVVYKDLWSLRKHFLENMTMIIYLVKGICFFGKLLSTRDSHVSAFICSSWRHALLSLNYSTFGLFSTLKTTLQGLISFAHIESWLRHNRSANFCTRKSMIILVFFFNCAFIFQQRVSTFFFFF